MTRQILSSCGQALSIAALITCHNRNDLTLTALERVFQQSSGSQYSLDVFVVDAGSTDGTREAIRSNFPSVNLIEASDAVYWTQGTSMAMQAAMERGYDLYLWLNDDVVLDEDGLARLCQFYQEVSGGNSKGCIVSGAMVHPDIAQVVYGGMVRRNSLSRVSLIIPPLSNLPQRIQSMHGNLVLIPHRVASLVGPLEPRFTQNRGDTDYGLRATELGVPIWLAPGRFGTCMPKPPTGRWDMASPNLRALWATVLHPKEAPPAESMIFLRRHAGPFWPLIWLRPYLQGFPMTLKWLHHRAMHRTTGRTGILRTNQQ